jgi:HAD superfamily hydrolase (TIGR01484 family)
MNKAMAERIGVVLSDVDGTQIIHGERFPSVEVQSAAHALRSNDVPLLEVTSRSHALMRKLVEPLDLRDNLCTLDGGATVVHADSGNIVWSQWLNAEHTQAVVTGIGRFCTNIHYDMDSRGRDPLEVLAAIEGGSATIESAPSVFAIFGAERGEEIARTLAGLAGVKHTPIMGYENSPTLRCIQVVDAGVDKQYGIEQMLRYGSLADQRRLAIGDGMNDLPLFAAASEGGVKVAMGNAPDELKDLADWVAPTVEEHGFAVAMERYGLI